jgi:hypothetical protein
MCFRRTIILWLLGSLPGLAGCSAAAAAPAARTLELKASTSQVGQYARIEFALDWAGRYTNPFDPEEADVTLEVKTPSGETQVVPAFYCQDYQRQQRARGGRKAEWLYPQGAPVWKARYAPAVAGAYSAVARVRDERGAVSSAPVAFQCVASTNKGSLRVSGRDPRFLEHADGSPFFALGQNVAFVTDTFALEETFRRMSAQGANFARIWTCCEDWAMAIEARKSAWGRSWDWRPPLIELPGREGYLSDRRCLRIAGAEGAQVAVSPSHAVALRPDTRYTFAGEARTAEGASLAVEALGARLGEPVRSAKAWGAFQREFTTATNTWWLEGLRLRLQEKGTALVRALSLKESTGGPELLWEADLDRPVLGCYNLHDCFMLDKVIEAAAANGIYLQLCLLTRDLYMDRLRDSSSVDYDQAVKDAQRLLRYAVARWGYSPNLAVWEYFNENNPGLPNDRFYTELGQYLEQVDIYHHLRTTSAWAACPKDWRHPKLDVANLHWYLRPAEGALFQDEAAAVLDRAKFLRQEAPGKPAFFAEYGITTDNWQRSPYLDQDADYTHLHNALWASALSGLSGAVLSWWWEDLDKHDGYRHYLALARFMQDVPLTSGQLREAKARSDDARWRVVGLQGEHSAYLWLADARATWYRKVVQRETPAEAAGVSFVLEGLAPGTYEALWWDTRKGVGIRTDKVQSLDGALKLEAPRFLGSIACKLRRQAER